MSSLPATTVVYDSYWEFAAERLAMYYRRLSSSEGPWTCNPVLRSYRFTNVFRATDRVSQYLIAEVQYGNGRSQDIPEVFFRTMLFKIFNRIDTWKCLEARLGSISWSLTKLSDVNLVLNDVFNNGGKVYSAAYIMPSPQMGQARKHSNHLALLAKMMADELPAKVASAKSLQAVYRLLLEYPGVGPFLAFQYAIDLNYSSIMDFEEYDYVVAGPGALDGISKCFTNHSLRSAEGIINAVVDRQAEEFGSRGLQFDGLFGRPLMPIDCQNIFCEISKYARAVHPKMLGSSGRTKIKQKYDNRRAEGLPAPFFPPKWGLELWQPEVRVVEWALPKFELSRSE